MDVILNEAEAREFYLSSDAAHDFDHVLRVTRMAERIALAEGADLQIVRLAALLHDVPSGVKMAATSDTRRAHHLAAADVARIELSARGLGTRQVDAVVHCIEAHRFRHRTVAPQTLEAQCLYDADKLDSIGAIGIARVFAYAGAHESRLWAEPRSAVPPLETRPSGRDYTPVHEYVYKLQQLLATLYTESARAIGQRRHQFMVAFFDRLDSEAQGEA